MHIRAGHNMHVGRPRVPNRAVPVRWSSGMCGVRLHGGRRICRDRELPPGRSCPPQARFWPLAEDWKTLGGPDGRLRPRVTSGRLGLLPLLVSSIGELILESQRTAEESADCGRFSRDRSQKVGFADAIRARETVSDSNKRHYASDRVSTEQDGPFVPGPHSVHDICERLRGADRG
jgi:hypothetical protein